MSQLAALRDALCEEALVRLLTGREEEARELLARARRMYPAAVRQIVSQKTRAKRATKSKAPDADGYRPYWDYEP